MTQPDRQRDPLVELMHRAASTEPAAARMAFLQRLDRELDKRSVARRFWLYAAPLALAALLLLALGLSWRQRGLQYAVRGAVDEAGYVQASAEQPAEITFSDRTRIVATAGARLRIDDQQRPDGARVSLERGSLEAEVTHTGHGNWRFVAGPFQVRVTGTRFTLAWDAEQERLEVVLHQGSVEVSGYAGSGNVSVRAGQRFVGDARKHTMLVADSKSEPPVPAASQAPPAKAEEPEHASPASEAQAEAKPSPAPAAPGAEARVAWSKLVSKGEFQRVVAEATARGTAACLKTCDAADLSALADASRYVGRAELAEQSLGALRERFAGSAGVRAAFLLGRLHEGRGDAAGAKRWYETALRESAGGAFAAEALAGKMRTTKTLSGPAAARSLAREYLERYPHGVDAKTARQIAEAP